MTLIHDKNDSIHLANEVIIDELIILSEYSIINVKIINLHIKSVWILSNLVLIECFSLN